MHETPADDFYAEDGTIRADGRMVRDMCLLEVKKPAGSTAERDLYKRLATIPGYQAFQPSSASRRPPVKQ